MESQEININFLFLQALLGPMYPIHMKFAVYGVSGAGKSTIINIIQKIEPRATVHKKDTTRPPRECESSEGAADLRFISKEEFEKRLSNNEYDIVYETYGNLYGLRRDQFIEAFKNKEVHFAIIKDIPALKRFKFMYKDVKAIYVHADPSKIPERLKFRDGVNFQERLRRTEVEYKEFVENSTLFDHVVINFWDRDNAVRQIKNIIYFYAKDSAKEL